MNTLVRTEWLKMRKYNAFWWLMGLTALAYPGINFLFYNVYLEITRESSQTGQIAKVAIGNPYVFPEVWHTIAYFTSCFLFIPAVLVIMFITNEYSFRTHRQNVIDGWSRKQFVTSKLVDVLILTLIITILYVAITLVTGFVSHTRLIRDTWGMSYYTGLFALQTFSQLTLAFLVGFFVRKAFIALGIFIIYFFPVEPILVNVMTYYKIPVGRYMPLEISDRMIPVPAFFGRLDLETYQKNLDAMNLHVILTIIFTT